MRKEKKNQAKACQITLQIPANYKIQNKKV